MITKEQIKAGIHNGTVQFICAHGEYGCYGTVCKIGDSAFYFGGLTADDESVAEYLLNSNMEDVVDDIFSVLENFRQDVDEENDFEDTEYAYYEAYLKEVVSKE